jgi:hypothetical protein
VKNKIISFLILLVGTAGMAGILMKDNLRVGAFTASSCVVDGDVDTAFSTTVDGNSQAGATLLDLAASTNLAAGDTLLADADNSGARKEVCVVSSVGSNAQITCSANLRYTHTAVQGDDVVLTNRIGPLTVGDNYVVTMGTTADAVQSGIFVMGDQYVNVNAIPGASMILPGFGDTNTVVKASAGADYISFRTQNANAISRACKIR